MLVVIAPGRQSFHSQFILAIGEEKVVEASLPLSEVEPAPLPPSTRRAPTEAIVLSVAGGVTATGGGVTLAMGTWKKVAEDRVGGAILLGVGGAVLVSGLVWTIFSVTRAPDATTSSAPAIALCPLPGGVWIGAGAAF